MGSLSENSLNTSPISPLAQPSPLPLSTDESSTEIAPVTELFQQKTEPLATQTTKSKFIQPLVFTAQGAYDEGVAIKGELKAFKTLSKEPAKIFEIENRLRVLLKTDFPEKEEYQNLYEQEVLPLLTEVKQSIKQNPTHFATRAAASKGEGLQAGLQAITNLTKNNPGLISQGTSAQKVFVLPQDGAVIKDSTVKAEEEEKTINSMFDLMSEGAVVGAFDIQRASASKFGIEISESTQARSHTLESLLDSPNLLEKINEKLSGNDSQIVCSLCIGSLATRFYENQPLLIGYPGTPPSALPLRVLQELNLAGQLPADAYIKTPNGEYISVLEHFSRKTFLSYALNDHSSSPDSLQRLVYLSPKLDNPEEKKAYKHCEKFRWSYINKEGKKIETDFKTIHKLKLQHEVMNDLEAIPSKTSDAAPSPDQLSTALNLSWKVVSKELMQIQEVTDSPMKPGKIVLQIPEEIKTKSNSIESILEFSKGMTIISNIATRLTEDDFYKVILLYNALSATKLYKTKRFQLQLPGQAPIPATFEELKKLNLAHQLPPYTRIQIEGEDEKFTFLEEQPSLLYALSDYPTVPGSPHRLYLSPKFNSSEEKEAYEYCEKFKWSYTNNLGEKKEADFKTIRMLTLEETGLDDLQAVLNPGDIGPSSVQISLALKINWEVVNPELMRVEGANISPIKNVQAKPFVSEMSLMKELNPSVQNAILQRLTSDAEFNAILTGELQLLDLHGGNLGVKPAPNDEYERYKNIKFSTPGLGGGEQNFNTLIIRYLDRELPPDTVIKFEEDGQEVQLPLKDLPDLQKALDVRWQFVIFDTDLSLSESNAIQEQIYQGQTQSLIPLRSVLLETTWKDTPLSDETVQRLINSDERDSRVEQWIQKADAPIYKRLSKGVREKVRLQVAPSIEQLSLSLHRKTFGSDMTIKSLQTKFVNELSDTGIPENLTIWKEIEDDLSSVIVRQDDTWETLAKRHQQDVMHLMTLNPDGFVVGQKVKISYDLTSNSPEALEKRKSIAAQLYPRITPHQQNALFERQHARKEYLTSYQALSQSTLTGEDLLTQVMEFIQKPETPLTSKTKKDLSKFCNKNRTVLLTNSSKFSALRNYLLESCKPSYFNIMKAMYPLLADTHELNKLYYTATMATDDDSRIEAQAGSAIGHYTTPINYSVDYFWDFPPDSDEYKLAHNLSDRINDIEDPAFFLHIG